MDDDNAVYYRLGFKRGDGWFVSCLQWFDEPDYDERLWATDHRFQYEEDAYKIIHVIHDWAARGHRIEALWREVKNTQTQECLHDRTIDQIVDATVQVLGQAIFRGL